MTFLRAEKTTPNEDALRTLLAGVLMAILIMVGLPMAQRYFDLYLLDRPIVRASLEIVRDQDDNILFLYDADAVKPVRATWVASVYSASKTRISTRRGNGNYSDVFDDPKAWSWGAFFDQEDGTPAPTIPPFPFYVCLRYISETIDTGVTDDSGQFCTEIFDPKLSE